MYGKAGGTSDGGVQPDGEGPSCLGGMGTREGGISRSTNLYSSVDCNIPVFASPTELHNVRNPIVVFGILVV